MVALKHILTCLAGASILHAAAVMPRSDRQTGTVKTINDRDTLQVSDAGRELEMRQKTAGDKKVEVIKAANP